MRSGFGVGRDQWLGLSAQGSRRMVKALLDTNILIDYLRGVPAARAELRRYRQKAISIISWMEVLVGADATTEHGTRDFLQEFVLLAIDEIDCSSGP